MSTSHYPDGDAVCASSTAVGHRDVDRIVVALDDGVEWTAHEGRPSGGTRSHLGPSNAPSSRKDDEG